MAWGLHISWYRNRPARVNRRTDQKIGRSKMSNFVYGIAISITVFTMVNIIDDNIPNNVAYYVDLVVPF